MYEKKVEDGFEVLEIEKGGWVEAIFAKLKPETEKMIIDVNEHKRNEDDDELDNDLLDDDGFDDEYDEEQMLEESYRTTFETEPEDLSLESAEVEDDYDD